MTSHEDHFPERDPHAEGPQEGPAPEAQGGPSPEGRQEDRHAAAPAEVPAEVPAEPSEQAPEEAAEEGWEGLSALSVWASTALVSLFMVPSAIVATLVLFFVDVSNLWALLPLPAVLAFIGLMTYLDMLRLRATRYRITAERMEMRSGIVAKAYRSIPRERVRSVDVAAPIYVRVFGLCSVTVGTGESAGAGGTDQLQLLYVTADQGERLRRELLRRTATRPKTAGAADGTAGTGGEAADEEETELVRLNPRWFAYAPATTATFGVGIGVIAALIGINAQSGGHGWRWISEQAGLPSAQEMSGFVMSRLLLVVPTALFALLLSGVLILVLVAVETWWDYRLVREADGTVRLRRGLLTSVSLSVEGRRLNGVVLHEPFVLRSVRGASIRAVATGLSAGDAQKTEAKSRLSPAMPRERARELGAALMREPDSALDVPLARHPRAALRRRFTRATVCSVAALALAGGLAWLQRVATDAWWEGIRTAEEHFMPFPLIGPTTEATPAWGWFLVALVFVAVAFWYAVGSYRGLGHGLHPKYLVVRKGMAVRTTVTLERSAVIGWRITRSPFQRRLGLADVSATTASGEGTYTVGDVGLGQGLAWADGAVPELLAPFLVREEGTAEPKPSVLP
ncbi:PH domain-containing protein [Nocardiopsis ganjiahuensis]|uniref:PH domain-containing protein n=1 Tax=Nocardiopsis ganjiahuensis TaxID=239984 RepID=UPI000346EC2F|nr:PH domain-containing protein [Nocardiopsis ganjiahuensis]